MKIEIELGVKNSEALKAICFSLMERNEGKIVIDEDVLTEVCKQYISNQYSQILLQEK